jgi:hypothetical protein
VGLIDFLSFEQSESRKEQLYTFGGRILAISWIEKNPRTVGGNFHFFVGAFLGHLDVERIFGGVPKSTHPVSYLRK